MTITIDSRGCGQGKTRSGIIPLIKEKCSQGFNILLVVPSIALQKQYLSDLALFAPVIINSEIDSEESVSQNINYALGRKDQIIIITHQAFINTPISPIHKINRVLIIDEVFDPFRLEVLNLTDPSGKASFCKFNNVFNWKDPNINHIPSKKSHQPWYELAILHTNYPALIQSPQWKRISNPNIRLWTTWHGGNNLMHHTPKTVQIISELNHNTILGYECVHIAGAAFEHTFMHFWLKKNKLNTTVLHNFTKHKSNLIIHGPNFLDISWSKNLKDLQPEIMNFFTKYIEQNKTGDILYVKNNDDRICIDGTKINHNAHGINEYRHFYNYAQLSALQPNSILLDFYKIHLNMSKNEALFAFGGYSTYQLLMRTALRDPLSNTQVQIFLLDCDIISNLLDLFDNPEIIDNIPVVDKRRISPIRKLLSEMDVTELKKYKELLNNYHIIWKNKDEEYSDYLTREINNQTNSLYDKNLIKSHVIRMMKSVGKSDSRIIKWVIRILKDPTITLPLTVAERIRAHRSKKE